MSTVERATPSVRTPHRFTVKQYQQLIDARIIDEGDRVELIEGVVVETVPPNSPHAGGVTGLNTFLVKNLPERYSVRCQCSLVLETDSQPEPDIAIVAFREDYYIESHPTGADTFLIVEVSDSSVRQDTNDKLSLYARNGIPEYWIVAVRTRAVTVYSNPQGEAYRTVAEFRDRPIVSATIDGLTVPPESCFGPKRTEST